MKMDEIKNLTIIIIIIHNHNGHDNNNDDKYLCIFIWWTGHK